MPWTPPAVDLRHHRAPAFEPPLSQRGLPLQAAYACARCGTASTGSERPCPRCASVTWIALRPRLERARPTANADADAGSSFVPHPTLPRLRDAPLRAPVSGLPCLAWRLRASSFARGGCQLIIDTCHSAALELGDERWPANTLVAQAPPERGGARLASGLDPAAHLRVRRFLHAHGCGFEDGRWVLEEQLVPLGVRVHVHAVVASRDPRPRLIGH